MRTRNAKKCQFQVELLEERIPLSASSMVAPQAAAAQVGPMKGTKVPYKESGTLNLVTLVGTSHATQLGNFTLTITNVVEHNNEPGFVDGTITQDFVRTAANGRDTMSGHTVETPAQPNSSGVTYTLAIYVDRGTGKFDGVTGFQIGTASVDKTTQVETFVVSGTLTFPRK